MKLSEVAKIMYDLQEYCREVPTIDCGEFNPCGRCHVCILTPQTREFMAPEYYNITKADIERLEREEG